MTETKKLIAVSIIFIAGWCLFRALPDDYSWHFWPFATWNATNGSWQQILDPQILWFYPPYLLALATMIEGSWKVLPMMFVGFCISAAMTFATLLPDRGFSLDSEERIIIIGLGCNFAVVFAATWLIRRRQRQVP